MWDSLPIGGATGSVLRFDQIQPIGAHSDAMIPTDYCLTQDALEIMAEWLTWFLQGGLPDQGVLSMLREELAKV